MSVAEIDIKVFDMFLAKVDSPEAGWMSWKNSTKPQPSTTQGTIK